MGSTVSAVKRVQFRLRAEDKGLLQLAASYEGESVCLHINPPDTHGIGRRRAVRLPVVRR